MTGYKNPDYAKLNAAFDDWVRVYVTQPKALGATDEMREGILATLKIAFQAGWLMRERSK